MKKKTVIQSEKLQCNNFGETCYTPTSITVTTICFSLTQNSKQPASSFFSSCYNSWSWNMLQHPVAKEMHQYGGGELTQQKMLLMKKATVRFPWLIVHG